MSLNFFVHNVRTALLQKPVLRRYKSSPCSVGIVKVTSSIVAKNAITVFIARS